MFKLTKGGIRRAGSGGVPRAKRVSSTQMGKVTTTPSPHTAFQPDSPGAAGHGFDSNSPRIDENN